MKEQIHTTYAWALDLWVKFSLFFETNGLLPIVLALFGAIVRGVRDGMEKKRFLKLLMTSLMMGFINWGLFKEFTDYSMMFVCVVSTVVGAFSEVIFEQIEKLIIGVSDSVTGKAKDKIDKL